MKEQTLEQSIKKYINKKIFMRKQEEKKEQEPKKVLMGGEKQRDIWEWGKNLADAYYTRSIWYAYQQDYEQSMKDIMACIKNNKNHQDAYYHMATLQYRLKHFGIALRNFKIAIKKDLYYIEAYKMQAKCYFKMGKQGESNFYRNIYLQAKINALKG